MTAPLAAATPALASHRALPAVSYTHLSLGEGEIVWDKSENAWYDEAGTRIDIEKLLGNDFQWYVDWWGSNGSGATKITTAELLKQYVNDESDKVEFNLADGGIDIFYNKTYKEWNKGCLLYTSRCV